MLGFLLRSSWELSSVKRHLEGLNGVFSRLEHWHMGQRRVSVVKCWTLCECLYCYAWDYLNCSPYVDKLNCIFLSTLHNGEVWSSNCVMVSHDERRVKLSVSNEQHVMFLAFPSTISFPYLLYIWSFHIWSFHIISPPTHSISTNLHRNGGGPYVSHWLPRPIRVGLRPKSLGSLVIWLPAVPPHTVFLCSLLLPYFYIIKLYIHFANIYS